METMDSEEVQFEVAFPSSLSTINYPLSIVSYCTIGLVRGDV